MARPPFQAFAQRLNGPCGTRLGLPDIEPRSSHNTDRHATEVEGAIYAAVLRASTTNRKER